MRDTNLRDLPITETEWMDLRRRTTGMTELQVRAAGYPQPWTMQMTPVEDETSASVGYYSQIASASQGDVPATWKWQAGEMDAQPARLKCGHRVHSGSKW